MHLFIFDFLRLNEMIKATRTTITTQHHFKRIYSRYCWSPAAGDTHIFVIVYLVYSLGSSVMSGLWSLGPAQTQKQKQKQICTGWCNWWHVDAISNTFMQLHVAIFLRNKLLVDAICNMLTQSVTFLQKQIDMLTQLTHRN